MTLSLPTFCMNFREISHLMDELERVKQGAVNQLLNNNNSTTANSNNLDILSMEAKIRVQCISYSTLLFVEQYLILNIYVYIISLFFVQAEYSNNNSNNVVEYADTAYTIAKKAAYAEELRSKWAELNTPIEVKPLVFTNYLLISSFFLT